MFKVRKFRYLWRRLKSEMTYFDHEILPDIIGLLLLYRRHLDGSKRELNPHFDVFWFSSGNCHWNVMVPCWLLNKRRLYGRYHVITNQYHSAIFDTKRSEILDPTYETLALSPSMTLEQFSDEKPFKIIELYEHVSNFVSPEAVDEIEETRLDSVASDFVLEIEAERCEENKAVMRHNCNTQVPLPAAEAGLSQPAPEPRVLPQGDAIATT